MDATSLVVAVITAAGTVSAAVVSDRARRHARDATRVGEGNARRLERVEQQTDGRQRRVIKTAVEEVVREHPELVTEAVADEMVRTVLDAILSTHLEGYEPRRRGSDS